jgi:hypothetical protein
MRKYHRLILLPPEPGHRNGYSIGVAADLARLKPGPDDLVLCLRHPGAAPGRHGPGMPPNDARTKILNLLQGRSPFEISPSRLDQVLAADQRSFEEVFAGECIFYRAVRALFPRVPIQVRFHNCYSLVQYRQSLRRYPIGWQLALNIRFFSRLEKEVFADRNVASIFVTEEDLAYSRQVFSLRNAELWQVVDPHAFGRLDIRPPTVPRLVFFGSASSAHTGAGVRFLCQRTFPPIRQGMNHCELHLFGNETEKYSRPSKGIFGHGRYEGAGLPCDGNGLFCVPDLHGCGIKLKIADLLKGGAPFISTPFGMTGYSLPAHPHVLVEELENWPARIVEYLEQVTVAAGARPGHPS